MDNDVKARALAKLKDPAFIDRVVAGLVERKKAEEQFSQSETFQKMVAALVNNPQPVGIDNEELAYFLEEVKTEIGWDFVTEADCDLFFSLMADPSSEHIEPGSYSEDPSCPFQNCSFRKHGLNVFTMYGQGVTIQVSNQ